MREPPVTILDHELAEEKASTLGRMGRNLEAALARLSAFDAAATETSSETGREERRRLVAEAGEALWLFAVQREALGLRDIRFVLRQYGVPPEVQFATGLKVR